MVENGEATTQAPNQFTGGQLAQAGATGSQSKSNSYLKVRGVPFTATKSDISQFFEEYNVTADQITMGEWTDWPSGNNFTGEAWVDFGSEDVANQAMQSKNKSRMGHRYIELFLSNQSECAASWQKVSGCGKGGGKGKGKKGADSGASGGGESTSGSGSLGGCGWGGCGCGGCGYGCGCWGWDPAFGCGWGGGCPAWGGMGYGAAQGGCGGRSGPY